MTMIGSFKLIFDERSRTGADVLAEKDRAKLANRFLLGFELRIDRQDLGQDREVFRSRQPGCEVRRLADPDVPEFDPFGTAQVLVTLSFLPTIVIP
jgi:hypothetical protein